MLFMSRNVFTITGKLFHSIISVDLFHNVISRSIVHSLNFTVRRISKETAENEFEKYQIP